MDSEDLTEEEIKKILKNFGKHKEKNASLESFKERFLAKLSLSKEGSEEKEGAEKALEELKESFHLQSEELTNAYKIIDQLKLESSDSHGQEFDQKLTDAIRLKEELEFERNDYKKKCGQLENKLLTQSQESSYQYLQLEEKFLKLQQKSQEELAALQTQIEKLKSEKKELRAQADEEIDKLRLAYQLSYEALEKRLNEEVERREALQTLNDQLKIEPSPGRFLETSHRFTFEQTKKEEEIEEKLQLCYREFKKLSKRGARFLQENLIASRELYHYKKRFEKLREEKVLLIEQMKLVKVEAKKAHRHVVKKIKECSVLEAQNEKIRNEFSNMQKTSFEDKEEMNRLKNLLDLQKEKEMGILQQKQESDLNASFVHEELQKNLMEEKLVNQKLKSELKELHQIKENYHKLLESFSSLKNTFDHQDDDL